MSKKSNKLKGQEGVESRTEIDENAALQKLSAFGAQFMAALGVEHSAPNGEQEQSNESSVENDDSDSYASSEDEGETTKQAIANNRSVEDTKQVEVMVFKDPTVQRTATSNRHDYKSFMSSKIEKINEEKTIMKPKSKEEQQEEIEDRIHDKELDDLLQSSNLIERIATEKLEGKDRRKFLQGKMVELGAKPVHGKGRLPFNVHVGIQESRKKKVDQQLEEARNLGMYRNSLRRELEDRMGVKRKKQDAVRKDRGIKMATGKYKDGALHISTGELQRIARDNGASSGASSHRQKRGGGGGGGGGKRSSKKRKHK
ncbi:hypothetical protein BDF22DRAFT_38969 [Syncephalis plumigaleata]|nr:hypothetical protein BDF22DRAFT_38969 [Syncephalis plumigaleata]